MNSLDPTHPRPLQHTPGRRLSLVRRLVPALMLSLTPLLGPAQASVVHADGTCTQSGSQVTCTFAYTGAAQSWAVPAGITQASFDLYGAAGGDTGGQTWASGSQTAVVPGGKGGHVQATLQVTPGQVLGIYVGGHGTSQQPAVGGFNGGAGGGTGADAWVVSGGGGGASDVRVGPGYGLTDRLLVAGGGGGAGGYSAVNSGLTPYLAGGAGGASSSAGATGLDTDTVVATKTVLGVTTTTILTFHGGGGGAQGSQLAGGPGGSAGESSPMGSPGNQGVLGAGGAGGGGATVLGGDGGGGGGGYYGGGGGGGGGTLLAGGMGSGGGGGGGGSNFGPAGAVMESGIQSGNGRVTITYTLPTPVSVSVSGSYVSGMPRALFTYTTNPAGVALTGTLSCTVVAEPNKYSLQIDSTLLSGAYTLAGSTCSGLSAPSGYSLAGYQGVPSGFLVSDPVPGQVEGARVRQAGTVQIYLIDDAGSKRYIPDPTTYNNLFRDWNGIQDVADVSGIATGPAITSGAYLAWDVAGDPVYLVTNGQKRQVGSPAVMDKFYFNWNAIRQVPQSTLDALPTGLPIN